MKYVEKSGNGTHSVGYTYDSINNLTALVETIGNVERTTSYTYDGDNRPTSVSANGGSRHYTYDKYGRVATLTTKHGNNTVTVQTYTYKQNANGTPTNQISGVTVSDGNGNQRYAYTYTYDQNGNITGISDGTYETSYAYDSANQLIREDNQQANTTTVWTYDNAGNILTRTVHPYATGTVDSGTQTNYGYSNAQWGDLLTAYNNRPIVRDEIGNPTNDFIWRYTWQHGRQLASMTRLGTSEKWEYTYNSDGMRTQRTNGTTTYNYTYLGGQLSHMTVDGQTMYFAYDASGTPLSLTYDGVTYYYVISILNSAGTEVVRYAYDAWGNLLSTTCDEEFADLGFYNPLRYRGYVYDEETGLYYLQSRYYNPEMGRFINADGYTATGQGLLGNNMFAYCGNNPVSRRDNAGDFWSAIFGAAIGGGLAGALINTVSYLSTSSENFTFSGLFTAMGTGAVSGAIGGVASVLGGGYAIGGSAIVGLFNGVVTACNTEGSLGTKLAAGAATAVITGLGTYAGTKILTPNDNALAAGVSAYAGGLTVGTLTEIINVTANQIINKKTNSPNAGSLYGSIYDVRKHLRAERALG